jgi:polyphosphate kinase
MKGIEFYKRILKLLYRSFDDNLTEKEQKQLTEALEKSEKLRQIKEEISALRQEISNSAAQSFKPFFAERVMSRINSLAKEEYAPEVFYKSLRSVFRPLAIACTLIMIVLLSYNLVKGKIISSDEIFYISETALEEILQLPLL